MDWTSILTFLQTLAPWVSYVLMGLGSLVVVGGLYVKMTPNQDDDAFYAKLEANFLLGPVLKALIRFSPISRNEPAAK